MSPPPPPLPADPPAASPGLASLRHSFLWLFVYMSAVLFLYLVLYVYNTCIRRPPLPPTAEEPPLPPRRVGGGKVFRYAKSLEKSDCAICLDDFRDGEVCRVLSKCKHVYHKACIDKWLTPAHAQCPLCRGSVHDSDSGSSHHCQRSLQINQIGIDQVL